VCIKQFTKVETLQRKQRGEGIPRDVSSQCNINLHPHQPDTLTMYCRPTIMTCPNKTLRFGSANRKQLYCARLPVRKKNPTSSPPVVTTAHTDQQFKPRHCRCTVIFCTSQCIQVEKWKSLPHQSHSRWFSLDNRELSKDISEMYSRECDTIHVHSPAGSRLYLARQLYTGSLVATGPACGVHQIRHMACMTPARHTVHGYNTVSD
jgi:hypothetical protein